MEGSLKHGPRRGVVGSRIDLCEPDLTGQASFKIKLIRNNQIDLGEA